MSPEERLNELGIELGSAPQPAGSYVPAVQSGNLLYVAGQGPRRPDGSYATGVVGENLSVEAACLHARLVGITILSVVKDALGDLSRVRRVVKVFGMVNAI